MNIDSSFTRLLETVRNPASYLGAEPNSVHKEPNSVAARIALAFPDMYELGMSHLGLKILYKIVNDQPDLAAERVFCPADDFADAMASFNLPLMALESRTPLSTFDIVGFTLPYELSTTTVLRMLDLARIPLLAADRSDTDPLIIGGGAGVYNPEPMADFFDFFVLGDGERITPALLRLAAETRGTPRAERLKRFATIDGVYVPSLFNVTYRNDGTIEAVTPLLDGYDTPRRIWLPTLAESPYPVDMIVPIVETTQSRVNVEIDRGCTQGCRFCQAGTTYRPVRERTPDEVMAIMEEAVARTGYEEVSVMSLSAGDYSQIGPLLTRLMDRYADDRVSLSMPSLRSATVTETIVEQVGRVKKTGFTLTAEAGSQRLRRVLNKKVDDDDIFNAARLLLARGWRGVKLYFMIGLPTETDDDVDAIYDLARELASLSVDGNRFATINVSVGNFVPKAHTAFQWAGQNSPEELLRKKERLFSLIRANKRIRLKYHESQMSQMEAAFSLGDRRLCAVTLRAYKAGCYLDGWSERYHHDRWLTAFAEEGLDPAFYASRARNLDETLPWDHIDTGLTKAYFAREWEAAQESRLTGDCKTDKCLACGLDPKGCFEAYPEAPPAAPSPPPVAKGKETVRLTYERMGDARFYSHLQTVNLVHRACKRAQLPIAYSEGYSPHPKLAFGPALPVGLESREEFLDLGLTETVDPATVVERLNRELPLGLRILAGRPKPVGARSIQESVLGARYRATFLDPVADLADRVTAFNAAETIPVVREGKKGNRSFDLKTKASEVEIDGDAALLFTLREAEGSSARPAEVIASLFTDKVPRYRLLKITAFS